MKVKLKVFKYGEFLSSRPEGREAALAAWAYHETLKKCTEVVLNFDGVLVLTPSWLSEFVQTLKGSGVAKIDYQPADNLSVQLSVKTVLEDTQEQKIHPWRLCPAGEHAVKTHPLHTRSSLSHPDGETTTRHFHCARNPSGKDQLYPLEIREIGDQHFSNLKKKPCPIPLDFKNGSKFDDLIAGWVQYWNEVLKPEIPLEPNFVKALIASESGFNPRKLANKQNSNSARGLMQVTNMTRKILGDLKGEIKNNYIQVTKEELLDPSTNICAGVRWLFHKQTQTSKKLKRTASWTETVGQYKGTSKAKGPRARTLITRFEKIQQTLDRCTKKS